MSHRLRPFWRYFGGKWRAARRYPQPEHDIIVEPFAGAAGYALRYPDRRVVLIEKNEIVAGVWAYLIRVSVNELLRIPNVDTIDELPAWVPQEAKWLVGLRFGAGDTRPRTRVSPMVKRDGGYGVAFIAHQIEAIRHWRVIHGEYTMAPQVSATWFIDPPYQISGSRNRTAGARGRVRYPNGGDFLNYSLLGEWCRKRRGLVIACENVGSNWLPFEPIFTHASCLPGGVSKEAVWVGRRA